MTSLQILQYYEQPHVNKFNNLYEIDKCLERHNLLKLPLKKIKTKQITPADPNDFREFYQPFKEEIISTLYKLFQKLVKGGILLNAFYEASIILILKPDKTL